MDDRELMRLVGGAVTAMAVLTLVRDRQSQRVISETGKAFISTLHAAQGYRTPPKGDGYEPMPIGAAIT